MLQEQAEWYQGKSDPYETTIFCIVNSEHYQTFKMEFSAKIIGGYFYKFLENIKYAFKKSEVASKRKVLPWTAPFFDLVEFLDLSLLNYIATTLH